MNGYKEILNKCREENRLRTVPEHRMDSGLIDLTSNDYMGLAENSRELKTEFFDRFGYPDMTSSASRLLASNQEVYLKLENYLGQLYDRPTLLFNSGYHANTGILSALSIPGTLIISDKLIHASAIDGVRLGKGDSLRFNHNDPNHLNRIIEKAYSKYERIIIVCESIYSMDGDTGPLRNLVELKKKYPKIILYVDEAHSIGVTGPKGSGLSVKEKLIKDIDIVVGTFGKAVASQGAFAAVSAEMKSYLINTARSLIFSTVIPPINAAWTLFVLEKLAGMDNERKHLQDVALRFREGIEAITGTPNTSRSAIIPLATGNAERAVRLSQLLERNGILALPIRRPTVPPGGERIRFSLHAKLSKQKIENILDVISECFKEVERL